MRNLRNLLGPWPAILVLAACDGNGGPTGPSGGIRGTYSGEWILRIVETESGFSVELECPGNVRVTSETSSTVSGTFALNAAEDCDSVNGTFAGTRTGDAIAIMLDPDPFETFEDEIEECTVVTPDDGFGGEIAGRDLSVEGSLVADCEVESEVHRIRFSVLFDGMRPA